MMGSHDLIAAMEEHYVMVDDVSREGATFIQLFGVNKVFSADEAGFLLDAYLEIYESIWERLVTAPWIETSNWRTTAIQFRDRSVQ